MTQLGNFFICKPLIERPDKDIFEKDIV